MAGVRLSRLDAKKTAFFLCDMQERFRSGIKFFPEIAEVSKKLLEGSRILDIPLVVTEQYPKGLGNTISELDIQHAAGVYPKTKFSMVVPEVSERMSSLCGGELKHIVLFGVEAHVCILQTTMDLLERGYDVHVVANATSSRNQVDRLFAFETFRHSGVNVTTSECVLFQLLGDKDHPKFKEVQSLIKESAPESGLVARI